MKKGLAIFTIIFIYISLFSDYTSFSINIEKSLFNNDYYNYNDKRGTPFVPYTVIINKRIKINDFDYSIEKQSIIKLRHKNNNYDYNIANGDSILLSTPNTHIELKSIGYSGNNTILHFNIFPIIHSDTVLTQLNIHLNYQNKDFKVIQSDFDNIIVNKNRYNMFLDLNNEKITTDYAKYDMIIITTSDFESCFNDYIQYNNLTGIRTKIFTLDYIINNYSGMDIQEKIRNFIKDMYFKYGIRFVLIGGDTDIVPIRRGYNSSSYYYGYVATDMYYADLDGDWNGDGDNRLGEFQEDSIDAFPEVIVTRLPFSNRNEFNTYFEKVHNYIFNNNTNALSKFLLVGASLLTNLSDGSGQLINDDVASQTNTYSYDYYSIYAPKEDTFNSTPMWNGNEQLNKNSFVNSINNGYHFINHIDHSHEYWLGTGCIQNNEEFFNSDTVLLNTNNSTYSIMFTTGCDANDFESEAITEVLLYSSQSPIVNITGFTRTGWTSSKYYNMDFWNSMLDNETWYVCEGFNYATNNSSYQYFRLAINMIGIPNLPVYQKRADTVEMTANYLNNTINVHVNINGNNAYKAKIIAFDSKNYYEYFTDAYGNVSFENNFNDTIIYLGASYISSIPDFDTLHIQLNNKVKVVSIEQDTLNKSNFIVIIKNNTDSLLNKLDIQFSTNDTLFTIDYSKNNISINPLDTIIVNLNSDFYKSPIKNIKKNIFVQISSPIKTYINDSIYTELKSDSFSIINFKVDTINMQLDSICIVNNNNSFANTQITIRTSNSDFAIKDSVFDVLMTAYDTVYLTDIVLTGNITKESIINSQYEIAMNAYNRKHKINVNGSVNDTVSFQARFTRKGIKLYSDNSLLKGYIYSSFDNTKYSLIDSFNFNEHIKYDTIINGAYKYYYVEYYDNIGRYVKTSDTVEVYTPFVVRKSNVELPGSFYGKLNGMRVYAKASFNVADLNNDLKNEYIVVSDNGRVFILDNNFNNITPFDLKINRFSETTPAIGDIDNNGEMDIVISGGASSDTSAIVILNPFSNCVIKAITGYGKAIASPVIYDINSYFGKEILLGTSKGFYIVNSDIQEITQYTKVSANITGIAVAGDKKYIAISDYYGHIWLEDFDGNTKSGFPISLGEITPAPFIMGDMDNNNLIDIVIGTASGNVYVIDENGAIRDNFPFSISSYFYQSPRLVDFNGDHIYKIVILDYNGNLYIIDKDGNYKTLYTGERSNTYNEPVIADVNGNNTLDIVFLTHNGEYYVSDENGNILDSMSFNCEIASTPIINSENGKMILTFKTVLGKIYNLEYTFSSVKSENEIFFPKTLFDISNTSYVNDILMGKNEKNIKNKNNNKIEFINIENNLIKNSVNIKYSIKKNSSIKIFNKLGSIVYTSILEKNNITKSINMNKFASGEYFVVINYNNKVYKKKILLVK